MNINDLIDRLKKISSGKNFPKILVLSGIAVMLLILFTDSGNDEMNSEISKVNSEFTASDNFMAYSEKKITDMLNSVEGVGKNKVMVTVSGTEEYVYAEEIHKTESQTEHNYVIFDAGNGKEALKKKVNNPSVSGVVVVCEGGDDPKVCEQVYKVISTAFNIPTNRIYVAEMK